jgi:methylated-DNA-[protein]-cysteine S-methyltransferase
MGEELSKGYYGSPVGVLEITTNEEGVVSLYFVDKMQKPSGKVEIVKECIAQLEEYFAGKRRIFTLPLSMQGSDFQKKVWKELTHIPFGKTVSYLYVAMELGDKNSTRAVGSANGQNPVSIIVPCHRVIGTSGKLVGYGGGLDKKRWLLEFERSLVMPDLFSGN